MGKALKPNNHTPDRQSPRYIWSKTKNHERFRGVHNDPHSKEDTRSSNQTIVSEEDVGTVPDEQLKKHQPERQYSRTSNTNNNFMYSFGPRLDNQKPGMTQEQEDRSKKLHAGTNASAQPLIVSAWTGRFLLSRNSINSKLDFLSAHLSSNASKRVCEYVVRFEHMLKFEMAPKSSIWPKSFERSKPTDDNIALYFFPALMKFGESYDYFIYEMIRDDLALRAYVNYAELLVLTSMDLPSELWRFQGKLYLLGVLRDRHPLPQD